jgi:hypothetical protein
MQFAERLQIVNVNQSPPHSLHHLDVEVCGLCQTGVSCESMIPAKQARIAPN